MKKWHGFAFLAAVALVAVGCASTTLVPAPSPGNVNARPPQTGTNIPRNIQEPASETPARKALAAASRGNGNANTNARPPQTGTNIPRSIQEPAPETRSKKPSADKAASAKAKPARAEKSAVNEEVVTRGGFR